MPLPELSESQINWLIQQAAEYIKSQRQKYGCNAAPLDHNQKAGIAPFFPQSVLDSAVFVVLTDERVSNPPFYPALVEMGFPPESLLDFSAMVAITFVDTIVFHEPITNQTLFQNPIEFDCPCTRDFQSNRDSLAEEEATKIG